MSTRRIPQMITLQEVSAALRVSTDTVRRMCDRGDLPYVQAAPGSAIRVAVSDLDEWISRHRVAPGEAASAG